jgi:L-alanine-DL-glutamate epimerase-like enolase superfamily enzyme
MRTDFETVELPLDVPFTISRGTTETTENVVVTVEHDGEVGYGAAAPSRRDHRDRRGAVAGVS